MSALGLSVAAPANAATIESDGVMLESMVGSSQVGSYASFWVTVRDSSSDPRPGAVVRLQLDGVNAGPPQRAVANTWGEAYFSVLPRFAGKDTITAWLDGDDDGVRGAAEPSVSLSAEWAPPPPNRLTTMRGAKSLGTVRYSLAPGRTARRVLRLSAARRAALRRSKGRVRVFAGAAQVGRAVVSTVR
jgi:hypothetical protein